MRPARKFALPEPEDEAMCQVRRTNILRGLVSLWAFVDHIPVPVAELSVCKHVGVSRLEDIDQERHATAAHYLFSVSHTPVNSSGEKATEEQKTILKNITHACTQTKVFRDYVSMNWGCRISVRGTEVNGKTSKIGRASCRERV